MDKILKRYSIILLTLCICFNLSACGLKQKENNKNITTLKLWHIFTSESDGSKVAIENAIKEWNDNNTNVKIEAEAVENEAYKVKIKIAISADQAPDIFYTWGAGFAKPFIDGNKVLPLDEYLQDTTKDKLVKGVLNNLTYENKTYGIPFAMYVGVLFLNKELFEQNNIKIPDNYNELLGAAKKFREKGIQPIAVGEKDRWPGMFYYNILALKEGGTKICNDALNKKASFEDKAFLDAAIKLQELVEAKAFNDGALGLSRDEAEAMFNMGNIPMYYNGSWVISNIIKEDSQIKDKIIIRNFPIIQGGKGLDSEFLGGANEGFMVSANAKNKEESVRAVEFICEKMAKYNYESGAGIPTWKVKDDTSKINNLTLQLNDMVSKATGFVPWWDVCLEGADAEKHKDLVSEIFGGKIKPEEFTKKMQEINNK